MVNIDEHRLIFTIFYGCGDPRMAVSVTWAALLAAAAVVELQPILAAVSRQLQHSPHWAGQRGGNGHGVMGVTMGVMRRGKVQGLGGTKKCQKKSTSLKSGL